MGSYLDKPVTDKESENGEGNGTVWGASAMQGWRTGMEDAHITSAAMSGELSSLSLFAVFDGHGGKEVALFCKEQVPPAFREHLAKATSSGSSQPAAIGDAMTRTYLQMDDMLRLPEHYTKAFPKSFAQSADGSTGAPKPRVVQMMEQKLKERVEADMAQARNSGKIDQEEAQKLSQRMSMLKKLENYTSVEGVTMPDMDTVGPASTCGCTAVSVVLTPSHIICANVGDSRAVLCRGATAKPLSEDHKPNNPGERARIEAAGGSVETQTSANGERVQHRVRPGGLSLSRALGDLKGKACGDLPPEAQPISAMPEVLIEAREPAKDEFLVIACDGIFDVMSNKEVCTYVRAKLLKGVAIPTICESMMDSCMCDNPKVTCGIGGDNMTCIIVVLKDLCASGNNGDSREEARSPSAGKSCCPIFGRGRS